MKARISDLLSALSVLSIFALFPWAYDEFSPPYWKFDWDEFADIPNVAPRKYFLLELVKRLDAACNDMTLSEFERVCGEPIGFRQGGHWPLSTKTLKSAWEAGTDENCDQMGLLWDRNSCSIKTNDIKAIFGEGIVKRPKPSRCVHSDPWLVYKRPWGTLAFDLGASKFSLDNGEEYVLGAVFDRDTITSRDKKARERLPLRASKTN